MKSPFRSIIVASLSVALLSTLALAGVRKAGNRPERSTATTQKVAKDRASGDRLQKLQAILDQLNLSDDQKTKIEAIKTEVREKLQSLKGTLKDLTKEERQAKVKETVGNVRERIAAILTEEQKTLLKEKLKEVREQNPKSGETKNKA